MGKKKKNKFYAIAVGRKTGIYTGWKACEKQVKGFSQAKFKGFADIDDARQWLDAYRSAQEASIRTRHIDYTIYTDGSCLNNYTGGPGGWAAVIIDENKRETIELSGGDPCTTNNRMELMAAIKALRHTPAKSFIALYTDSQYLKNGLKSWISRWKLNGWTKLDGKPVLNKDLWMELDNLTKKREMIYRWVKGHNGDEFNERCDELAKEAAEALR